ncbi:MAG: hypothetical protein FJX47_08655 [Alphaproteobacteria bacterium]|nr:hypothetical protein [Alphaproteobacteria bacterium]
MRSIVFSVLAAATMALSACVGDIDAQSMQTNAQERPQASELVAGLSTQYWYYDFRNLRDLLDLSSRRQGNPGDAIAQVNGVFGEGQVLTSGVSDFVGARIEGFINLAEPGRYTFTANSNDGVRVDIAGLKITEDPLPHPDRFSPPGFIDVVTPGWHPIRVYYYERRGSATLQLYWTRPGQSTPEIVPAASLGRKRG